MKLRKELTAREVDVLRDALERKLGDTSVPTLPDVAIRIIELVTNPTKGMQDFARVIETDQALTGRLLRMVNSAMYAQRSPVTQLNRAMVLLGIDRLKAVVLGFHLSQATTCDEGDFSTKRVWTQSIFRAWLSFHLCERFDRTVTGEAFVVGLMLDAAMPLMPRLIGDDYFRHVRSSAAPQEQMNDEMERLPFTHVDLAHALCKLWRLPETLARPIVSHHTRPQGFNPKNAFSVLHAVAYYAGSLHLTDEAEGGEGLAESPCAGLATTLLGIELDDLRACISNAARDFAASKAIFSHVMDPSMTIERILQIVNQELSSSVESLVVGSLKGSAKPGATRFEIQNLVLEMEPAPPGKVKVFLVDESGERIFSEDIQPDRQGGSDLRSMLLHHNANERQIAEVLEELIRLAA